MSRLIKAGQAAGGRRAEPGTGASPFPLTQLALPLPAAGQEGAGTGRGGGAGEGHPRAAGACTPGGNQALRQEAWGEERWRAAEREAQRVLAEARAERERLIAAGEAERDRLVAEGRAEAERLLAEARAERERLLEAVSLDVAGLVVEAARRVLRHELACQPEAVVRLVRELMAEAGARGEATVRVNPGDASLLQERLKEVTAGLPEPVEVRLVPDPGITAGGAVVETAAGTWDGRVQTQLAAVEEALRGVTGGGR